VMWWAAIGLGVFAMLMHLLIVEGPVADPPAGGRRVRVASASVIAVLCAAAVWAALSYAPTLDRLAAEDPEPVVSFCVLGPLLHPPG